MSVRLPDSLRRGLLRWAHWYASRRAPDNPIGGDYLHRWYVTPWRGWSEGVTSGRIRGNAFQRWMSRLPNVYLHRFGRSDYDRALHDHPWSSISIILDVGYYEHVPVEPDVEHSPTLRIWRPAGTVTWRRAQDAHRVELPEGSPWVWTLFITGFRIRQWGSHCQEGWRSYPEWDERGGCD